MDKNPSPITLQTLINNTTHSVEEEILEIALDGFQKQKFVVQK